MGFDKSRRVHEAIRESWKSIAARRRQGSAPRIWLVIAAEYREVKVSSAAHACDVREHLTFGDHLAWPKSRSRPHVPVLREDYALRSLVPDEHPAFKDWIHDVAGDHPVGGCPHRLDTRADVDTCVKPDRPRRRAASKDSAVANCATGCQIRGSAGPRWAEEAGNSRLAGLMPSTAEQGRRRTLWSRRWK